MLKEYGISQKSNDILLYSSRDTRYKKPFGAVATDENIEITFPVKSSFNAKNVTLILRKGDSTRRYNMTLQSTTKGYDNFYLSFSIPEDGTYFYRFEISCNNHLCFVGKINNGFAYIQDWLPEWQLSVYDKDYRTPDEYAGGICYHIFIDRFCKKNQTKKPRFGTLKKWEEDVTITGRDGIYRADDFYAGNLQGVISKLDYLESLGVDLIYLSPVFEASSNHRYDTGDYHKIDALIGQEKDFQELIHKTQQKNMGIILDGVFNHTGADSLYFNKYNHYPTVGAFQSTQSPYHSWYTFTAFPHKYDCWWGISCVPTIARDATEYQEMIAGKKGILEERTSQGIKGWRLDVVDELSSDFVENIYAAIKSQDPDALVIGEVWEDASTKHSYGEERRYFRGKQLDGVMNYPFRNAIIDYINNHNAEEFIEQIMTICENYPLQSLNCCMSLLGSHDTVRILNILAQIDTSKMTKEDRRNYIMPPLLYEEATRKLKIASALLYFLPGIVTIYYGDEIGMTGFEDPINRRPFDLGKAYQPTLAHYRKLGKLRKNYKKVFSGMFDNIGQRENVIHITRGSFLLIANPTNSLYRLSKPKTDYLSNKLIKEVKAQSVAIIAD